MKPVEEKPKGTDSDAAVVEPFDRVLARHGLDLRRGHTHTLQVNVGLLCNMLCRHCHLEAGPGRNEVMSRETMDHVIAYARRVRFSSIDITGGAPEMVPGLDYLLERLAPVTDRLMLRSNLTALAAAETDRLIELFVRCRVKLIASFPSTSAAQMESQRGGGAWETSIAMLRRLNAAGYGQEGSGLVLDLVVNPAGAYLPPPQAGAEKKFRQDLQRKWGVVFSQLYTFANVPLGRFQTWLVDSGNCEAYMRKLAGSFNPCTVAGLMCRNLITVAWDGQLYDCDFNQAAGLPFTGVRTQVSQLDGAPPEDTVIPTGEHCYACTAGTGFT